MNSELNQYNKNIVWNFWKALDNADAQQAAEAARLAMDERVTCFGPDPINQLDGIDAFLGKYWLPLKQSFPDIQRQSHLFLGGISNGRVDGDISRDGKMWVGGTGLLNGTFERDYLGIPATGRRVSIRWGECCQLEQGKIVAVYFLLDLIDLIQQAGFQILPPSLGKDGIYPPPQGGNGTLLDAQNQQESQHSLDHIWRFIFNGLNSYDQSELKSMGMADFFRADVHWYGPGGIGACLSLKEFEDFHQRPWLVAFPDRSVQDLNALFAEGAFSGAPGFAGVKATHQGPYLDCPATGKPIEINGLDWWKREDEMYVENWVFVDMIHLFRQFGIDLFERLSRQIKPKV
ncbi:MAG: ester cyclase [Chloroflexi bacterium]|nr:ester cyclase [Chloroflexota bacterium]